MNNLEINYADPEDNSELTESSNSDMQIFKCENDKGFYSDLTVQQSQLKEIAKLQLRLTKDRVFNTPSLLKTLTKSLSRKNEIFNCISTEEMSVDISNTSGNIYLPLLTRSGINSRLQKIPADVRKKINMLHIGAVKILVKAQFRDGIDTPIKMALIDNRIINRKDCILGAARGNLAFGKFMFTVYPKFAVSLETKNVDQVLSLIHEFEKTDLMRKGDKVFSVTYLLGYALTNSHHSIDYKDNPNIEIDEIFSNIGSVEDNKFCDLSTEDKSWAIDIAREKDYLGQKPRKSISNNRLEIGQSSRHPTLDKFALANMSKRIDQIGNQLDNLIG